jgi:hypothetical protein
MKKRPASSRYGAHAQTKKPDTLKDKAKWVTDKEFDRLAD